MLQGEDDIQSSLRVLLATKLGERVMQPLFGCNLDAMVFELLDTTLKTEMKNLIERAILFFEPRINIDKIDLDSQNDLNGVVVITVNYIVRSTNTRGNLVFPFYLSEV
jgi:phage baseplate assembly protein W